MPRRRLQRRSSRRSATRTRPSVVSSTVLAVLGSLLQELTCCRCAFSSDPEKRKMYDQFGDVGNGQPGGGGGPGGNPFGGGGGDGTFTFTFNGNPGGGGGGGFSDPRKVFEQMFSNFGGGGGSGEDGEDGGGFGFDFSNLFGGGGGGQRAGRRRAGAAGGMPGGMRFNTMGGMPGMDGGMPGMRGGMPNTGGMPNMGGRPGRGQAQAPELFSDEDDVILLTGKTFKSVGRDQRGKDVYLVMFYETADKASEKLATSLKKVATMMRGIAKVAAINVATAPKVAEASGVTKFPTVMLLHPNGSEKVEGTKARTLVDAAKEVLPSSVTAIAMSGAQGITRGLARLTRFLSEKDCRLNSGCSVLLTDQNVVSPLYRSLSVQLEDAMAFAQVTVPDGAAHDEAVSELRSLLQDVDLSDLPVLLCVKKRASGSVMVTSHKGELSYDPVNAFLRDCGGAKARIKKNKGNKRRRRK